ncbi:MAG TPA: hypothetical protein VEB21_14200 [Terriglobales bacterium]|nr:hypothetical protein [Terriglobales bacterium]
MERLTHAAGAYESDPFSGRAILLLVEAFDALTVEDKRQLAETDKPLFERVRKVVTDLSKGKMAIALLQKALSQQERNQPKAEEQLITAILNIGAFEEAIATPEQKQLFAKAHDVARSVAKATLEKRVSEHKKIPTAATIEALAATYDAVKGLQPAPSDEAYQQLLTNGREASDKILQSNRRLSALEKAASDWKTHGLSSRNEVLYAILETTSFDRERFTPQQTEAWSSLSKAEAILTGPAVGLSSATKDRVPIFVDARDERIAGALSSRLRSADFNVVQRADEAALWLSVTSSNIVRTDKYISGSDAGFIFRAEMAVKARWVVDSSVPFSEQIIAEGPLRPREADARLEAASAAVNKIVTNFNAWVLR